MRKTHGLLPAMIFLLTLAVSACAAQPYAGESGQRVQAPATSPKSGTAGAVQTPVPGATTTPIESAVVIRPGGTAIAGAIKWNVQDPNTATNRNACLAAQLLKATAGEDLKRKAESFIPASLKKAPWDYYGRIIKLTGVVRDSQDFPRGNQLARELEVDQVGKIVIVGEDQTLIEYLHLGSIDDVRVDQTVSVYGYPVGLTDVNGVQGAKPNALSVVGKTVEKN